MQLAAAIAALQRVLVLTHPRVALSHWSRLASEARARRQRLADGEAQR